METIETTINHLKDKKFICDYSLNDSSKRHTINGINRAIVVFDKNVNLLESRMGSGISNLFYHAFSIPHKHLPTPYEVRK